MGVAMTAQSKTQPLLPPPLVPAPALYSLATPTTLLACALEHAVVFHVVLALALSLPPPELLFFRKQRLKQRRLLLCQLSLAFLHCFVVAAQITAVARMKTKMIADFIFNQ